MEKKQQTQNIRRKCRISKSSVKSGAIPSIITLLFLLGQKDWDEELLNLIPIVSEAKEDEVNGILHEWFVSLGEIDYKTISKVPEWVGVTEENKIVCTDTAWISEDYLGKELSADLQQFEPLPNVNRGKAPVSFSSIGVPDFSNEKTYENIDYSNQNYRLLGLFRVGTYWNTISIFEMMDEDWDDLLSEYIPKIDGRVSTRKF